MQKASVHAATTAAKEDCRRGFDWEPQGVSKGAQLTKVVPVHATRSRAKAAAALTDLKRVGNALESHASRAGARVIGLTSASPGEGVSTCAAAISFLLAGEVQPLTIRRQTGSPLVPDGAQRAAGVVLVDANLKDPFVHQAFGVPISPGLRDGLRSGQSLATVAHRIEGSQLLVIPAGSGFGTAGMDVQQLAAALQQLAQQVRLVIVDLPAVLSSEGVKYAMLCDAVVMVVRAHHTRWEAVLQARRILERAGVPILGAVLNRRRFDLPRWLYERL